MLCRLFIQLFLSFGIRINASAVILVVQIIFTDNFIPAVLSAGFFEVRIEIMYRRMFFSQLCPDGIEHLGIFLTGDGHDGCEIVKVMVMGILIGFIHAQSIAHDASSAFFRLIFKQTDFLCVGFIVIVRDNEFDFRVMVFQKYF